MGLVFVEYCRKIKYIFCEIPVNFIVKRNLNDIITIYKNFF